MKIGKEVERVVGEVIGGTNLFGRGTPLMPIYEHIALE